MVSRAHYTRIDTVELKALIFQKIGHQRTEQYFNLLNQLFSSKISKSEFDKFCIRIFGREHLSLHNRFIRSIIKNASLAKVPPPKVKKPDDPLNVKVPNGYQRNCLQSLYCDTFPPSPRKGRSPVSRDRKFRDRPSPLGPLGKTRSPTCEQSPTELNSLGSRPPIEVASVEDGEEVEQIAASPSIQSRSPVTAPLGISINFGGSRRTLFNGSINNFYPKTCQNGGELPDTGSLRSRLDHKLEAEGLGVSVDCVNLLNNGVDVFLKRLIEPCMGLARSKCEKDHLRQLNGQTTHGFYGNLPGSCMQRPIQSIRASMLDFRVSMESNPWILGEDWAIQLEKVCARAYEE